MLTPWLHRCQDANGPPLPALCFQTEPLLGHTPPPRTLDIPSSWNRTTWQPEGEWYPPSFLIFDEGLSWVWLWLLKFSYSGAVGFCFHSPIPQIWGGVSRLPLNPMGCRESQLFLLVLESSMWVRPKIPAKPSPMIPLIRVIGSEINVWLNGSN